MAKNVYVWGKDLSIGDKVMWRSNGRHYTLMGIVVSDRAIRVTSTTKDPIGSAKFDDTIPPDINTIPANGLFGLWHDYKYRVQ
jgi:hypothetical protein